MNEREFRVIGPPGTGKTTYLARQVERAVEAGRRPLVTSLTKAAAHEIGGRCPPGWGFSSEQVGTLHSHCHRALGRPQLIAKQEQIDDWNGWKKQPEWQLSLAAVAGGSGGGGDERGGREAGDGLYSQVQVLRAQMKPSEIWGTMLIGFWRKFSEWKLLNGLMDFGDLIEQALRRRVPAPFDPDVIFVDEAQDHDRLELSVVRQWAAAAGIERSIIVGDPDQNLYEWRGADPGTFYEDEIPAENTRVLSQSYRVPRAVHAKAQEIIQRCEGRRAVEYLPTAEEGVCRVSGLSLRDSHLVVEEAARVADEGRSVMILAACDYMLAGVLSFLRRAGIPFGNPYAPHRGHLNPLGERNGITSAQRLAAFLVAFPAFSAAPRRWTVAEFDLWLDPLTADGWLVKGAKKRVSDLARTSPGAEVTGELLRSVLAPGGEEQLRQASENPLGWFRSRLNKSRAGVFEFPEAVVSKRGAAALHEKPRICVGTIHSVKGGEADVVFLFPNLSMQGAESFAYDPGPIWRMFYVGATRAKQELLLCRAASSAAVRW